MSIKKTSKFRPFVERVMPAVYDDSLTYYEMLSKVVAYLNQMNDQANEIIDFMDSATKKQNKKIIDVQTEFIKVRDFLNDAYELFKAEIEHDVMPANIETVLDGWFESGRLAEIINNNVFDMKANTVDLNKVRDRQNSERVNVKYPPPPLVGAIGDGVTDDTEKIQIILNTYKKVLIPNGTFLVTGLSITMHDQDILCLGKLKLADNTFKSVIRGIGYDNIRIFGVVVDGNADNNLLDNGAYTVGGQTLVATQETATILLENCDNSNVENCVIVNAFATPIVLKSCFNSHIYDCYSLNHRREGFGIVGGEYCSIEKCVGHSDSTVGIAWSQFYTNGIAESELKYHHKVKNNLAINSQAAFITINTKNTEVTGNKVIKTNSENLPNGPAIRLGHAIDGLEAHNCVVKQNKILNIKCNSPFGGEAGKRGISCDNARGSEISDNDIQNCIVGIGASVTVGQTDILIRNNRIKNTVEKAIDVFETVLARIIDNIIEGANTGINSQAFNTYVKGNVVVGAIATGIRMMGGSSGIGSDTRAISNIVYLSEVGCVNFDLNVGVKRHFNLSNNTPVSNSSNGTFGASGNGQTNLYMPHGLHSTPTYWTVTPASNDAGIAGIKYVEVTATHVIVHFNNPLPVGSNNITFKWRVEI